MTKTPLTPLRAAAEAIHAARALLERIDGQRGALRQKLEEIAAQNAALAQNEERRGQLLEEALLADRKADTGEVDKQIAAGRRALDRLKDERIAVERALPALKVQREAAEAALVERRVEYGRILAEHVASRVRKAIPATRELAAQFNSAIADLRACIDLMPESEQLVLDQEVNVLMRELTLFKLRPEPGWATVQVIWTAAAAAGPVTREAQTELVQAREATGLAEEPALPPSIMPDEPRQSVWSDGTVHDEPEPLPPRTPRVIQCGRVNDVTSPAGMPSVRTL